MEELEQLDRKKDVLRLLENYLVFHSGRMNHREHLSAGLSIGIVFMLGLLSINLNIRHEKVYRDKKTTLMV